MIFEVVTDYSQEAIGDCEDSLGLRKAVSVLNLTFAWYLLISFIWWTEVNRKPEFSSSDPKTMVCAGFPGDKASLKSQRIFGSFLVSNNLAEKLHQCLNAPNFCWNFSTYYNYLFLSCIMLVKLQKTHLLHYDIWMECYRKYFVICPLFVILTGITINTVAGCTLLGHLQMQSYHT